MPSVGKTPIKNFPATSTGWDESEFVQLGILYSFSKLGNKVGVNFIFYWHVVINRLSVSTNDIIDG